MGIIILNPATTGKEVKVSTTSYSSTFSTTSTSYVDVTSLTGSITGLTANKTYDLFVSIVGVEIDNTTAQRYKARIVIDGTNCTEINGICNACRHPCSLTSVKKGVTGATSYTAKLQVCQIDTGTININRESLTGSVQIIAVEV